MTFRVVIPARHASTRLPGKPLLRIAGRSLLQWVHERALASGATEVLVATDDERILDHARSFGAQAMLTAATHASGTDRIAEVARARGWAAGDIVVNLQGDEPLMRAELVAQVAALLAGDPEADIATLAAPLAGPGAWTDPNVVKVVADARGRALYFSRASIPCDRDAVLAGGEAAAAAWRHGRRHIGLYAYRVGALLRLAALPVSPLEGMEKLEQLRALENGMRILLGEARVLPGPDVNTPEDLARVEALLTA